MAAVITPTLFLASIQEIRLAVATNSPTVSSSILITAYVSQTRSPAFISLDINRMCLLPLVLRGSVIFSSTSEEKSSRGRKGTTGLGGSKVTLEVRWTGPQTISTTRFHPISYKLYDVGHSERLDSRSITRQTDSIILICLCYPFLTIDILADNIFLMLAVIILRIYVMMYNTVRIFDATDRDIMSARCEYALVTISPLLIAALTLNLYLRPNPSMNYETFTQEKKKNLLSHYLRHRLLFFPKKKHVHPRLSYTLQRYVLQGLLIDPSRTVAMSRLGHP